MNHSKIKFYPALAALGGTLAAGQAAALEIGRINVQSTLGEPLRASIAYALGPNEQLAEYCIALAPASPGFALPSISRATVNIDKGLITITGSTVLREPLATLRLDISCPYTPRISREYMLMIDPASGQGRFDAAVPASTAAPDTETRLAAVAADEAGSDDRATTLPPLEPLFTGDRLLVEPGHTLSRIIAAVGDRGVDRAEAVRRIVDANPAAFTDGDPDRLEAGTWLTIPDLAAASVDTYPSFAPTAEEADPAAQMTAETPAAKPYAAAQVSAPPAEPARPEAPEAAPPAAESLTVPAPNAGLIDDTDFLEPAPAADTADASAGNDATGGEPQRAEVAAPAGATIPASDQQAERPAEPSAARAVAEPAPPPVRRAREPASGIPTFWYWLIGGGTAAIAGLLALFYRSRRATAPDTAAPSQPRPNPLLERVKQAEGIEVEPIQAFTAPDFNLTDDSPTAENPTLDAGETGDAGLDDDGAIAADLGSDADFHAHRDVDINLDAVRYEEGDDDAPGAANRVEPVADDVDEPNAAAGDDVDVDLSSGSGFEQGEHTRVDENFTFARTTALDFELPEENSESEPQPGTDVIPPLNIEESSILKSEVLPDDDDDDYDVSMILDATKQPDPSEVTEKDLHAVVVDAGDATLNSGEYTVARDPDFELLEQDYEDELSATQALNMEIERAAAELAGRIDGEENAPTEDMSDYELTQELPTDVAPMDEENPTAVASLDDDDEALTAESAAIGDDAPTAIAALDEEPEPATDVALLDDETIDAAIAASVDEEAPTAIAPLDAEEEPTAIAPLDAEEEPTAVAPLDADADEDEDALDNSPADVASLEDTSIESQLAHLPGEASAEAANDDPLLDENDATGVNAALSEEITEADKTIEMARDDEEPTIRLSEDEDDTVEMPPRSKNA